MRHSPRDVAIILVRLGTIVFPGLLVIRLMGVAAVGGVEMTVVVSNILAAHAAMILAFIGGLLQAAGVADGKAVLWVPAGIVLALLAQVACGAVWCGA